MEICPFLVADGRDRQWGLRQAWYGKHLGELQAHQVSTLTAIVLFSVYIWFVMHVWPPASETQAIAVGLLWLAMTVAFEFLLSHYVAGHPWDRLLHDYNLFTGHVWVILLAWVTVAPYIFFRLRG